MELRKAVKYILAKGEEFGAEQVEVYGVKFRATMLTVEKGDTRVFLQTGSGISVRAVTGKNYGFSYTLNLSESALESTLKSALAAARAKGEDRYFKSLPEPMETEPLEKKIDHRILEFTPKDMLEFYDRIRRVIKEKDIEVFFGAVVSAYAERIVANSLGVDFEDKTAGFAALLYAGYIKEIPPALGFSVKISDNVDEVIPEEIANEILKEVERAKGAKSIKFDRKTTVVFEPMALSMLLGIFAKEVAADSVDRKATPFTKEKLGEKVASEVLCIRDNARSSKNPFRSERDDEGVPTSLVPIIEKGVLKTFLTDYYYASKWGVKPTGNAVRGGMNISEAVSREPTPSVHFLEIYGREEEPLSEIIKDVKEGFLVRDVMGVHMSDFSSGKFSVPAFGWYIENGEVKYPVRNIMLSGTIPEVLSNIYAISKEKKVVIGDIVGKYPYLTVKNVSVSATPPAFKEKLMLTLINMLIKLNIIKSPLA